MKHKYLLILTGVDGAGKTTQSKLLRSSIGSITNITVYTINFEPPIWLTILQQLFIKCRRRLKRYENDYNKSSSGKCVNFARNMLFLLYYLFLGTLFYIKLMIILLSNNSRKLIICDRYPLIDGLTYISFRTQSISLSIKLAYLWLIFEMFLQKISMQRCVQLHIDPYLSIKRRPEHSIKRQKIHQYLIYFFCTKYLKSNYDRIDVSDKSVTAVYTTLLMVVLEWLRKHPRPRE